MLIVFFKKKMYQDIIVEILMNFKQNYLKLKFNDYIDAVSNNEFYHNNK